MTGFTPGREDADTPEPVRLRRLRQLVTVLTATLIFGVITIVALLVIRVTAMTPTLAPLLPDALVLPAGERARAATFGAGWVAVVTGDAAGVERIRVFDAATGEARGAIDIERGPGADLDGAIAD